MSGGSSRKTKESKAGPKQREAPPRLHDLVGYHLKRASLLDLEGANAALEPSGLRIVAMSVLLSIVEQPGVSSAAICRALRLQRANIVPILADLGRRELFLRETDPSDNRIQRLYPTAKGEEEALRMLALIAEHEERMLAGLTMQEREELRRMLAIIWTSEAARTAPEESGGK